MVHRTLARGRFGPDLGVSDRLVMVTVLVGLIAAIALTAGPADALTVRRATVARIGAGAARLTMYTTGTGTLYVNLRA